MSIGDDDQSISVLDALLDDDAAAVVLFPFFDDEEEEAVAEAEAPAEDDAPARFLEDEEDTLLAARSARMADRIVVSSILRSSVSVDTMVLFIRGK